MLTREELSDEDVILFFDIVQSVVPTKLITAYDDEKAKVGIEVIAYTDEDDDGDDVLDGDEDDDRDGIDNDSDSDDDGDNVLDIHEDGDL